MKHSPRREASSTEKINTEKINEEAEAYYDAFSRGVKARCPFIVGLPESKPSR